jgi:hypothetical protein
VQKRVITPSFCKLYCHASCCFLQGQVTYADWTRAGWHPKTFLAKDITTSLIQHMRGGGQAAAVEAAALLYAAAPNLDAETAAALAQAYAATLSDAEAEVAAELAAAREAAAHMQDGDDQEEEDDPTPPPCEAAAAIYSALTTVFQPLDTGLGSRVLAASAEPTADIVSPERDNRHSNKAVVAAEPSTQSAATRHTLSHAALHVLQQQPATKEHAAYGFGVQRRTIRLLQESLQLTAEASSQHSTESAAAAAVAAASVDRAVPIAEVAGWIAAAGYVALASHCPLFARKFPASVANHTLAMALSCAGVGLGSWCSDQSWLAQAGLHV